MAIYVISDIHGYLDALRSALAVPIAINQAAKKNPEIEPIDLIVVAGDVIGYGPEQIECAQLLMKMERDWFHDEYVQARKGWIAQTGKKRQDWEKENPEHIWAMNANAKELWTPSKAIAKDIKSQSALLEKIVLDASPDLLDTAYEPIRTKVTAGNHEREALGEPEPGVDPPLISGAKMRLGGEYSARAEATLKKVLEYWFGNYIRNKRDECFELIKDSFSKPSKDVNYRIAQAVVQRFVNTIREGFTHQDGGNGEKSEGDMTTTQVAFKRFAQEAFIQLTADDELMPIAELNQKRKQAIYALGWLRELVKRGEANGYKEVLQGHKYGIIAAHSNPLQSQSYDYVKGKKGAKHVAHNLPQGTRMAFFGHTHIPVLGYDPETGNMAVNVGRVGDPRGVDPETQEILPATGVICYTHLDPREGSIMQVTKPYNYGSTIERMTQLGFHKLKAPGCIPNELERLAKEVA